jgi:hypothetical protein
MPSTVNANRQLQRERQHHFNCSILFRISDPDRKDHGRRDGGIDRKVEVCAKEPLQWFANNAAGRELVRIVPGALAPFA